jgi:hypothetical protein
MSWRRDSGQPGAHRTAADRRTDRDFREQQHEREMEDTRRDIERIKRLLRAMTGPGHELPIRQAR